MKIPLSLIQKFIYLEKTPQEIADLLTSAGIEVEKIENPAAQFEGVVAAKILEVSDHPKSEKLALVTVFDGEENHHIVCGDKASCTIGKHVALAKCGAILHKQEKPFVIKEAIIRNTSSKGMLCSAMELDLYPDHSSILDLPEEIAIGSTLEELCDPIFEISLTPNLGHCMSALGIARELSALTKTPIQLPDISLDIEPQLEKTLQVRVSDFSLCPRYSCLAIKELNPMPTPFSIKKTLFACGMRPINLVVDILNYTMLLFGQPMHAFDLHKIADNQINISPLEEESIVEGLDRNQYTLKKGTLVVKDRDHVQAIAGILGLARSEVTPESQEILLESASFSQESIRKTSKELNLKTESSMRFEKGIDLTQAPFALKYSCSLLQKIAKAKVFSPLLDIYEETIFCKKTIPCRLSRINQMLGTKLSSSEVEEIFSRLGLAFEFAVEEELFHVTLPLFRHDLSEEIDLIEEVLRIYGIDNIPKKNPYFHLGKEEPNLFANFTKTLKEKLLSLGLQEVITCNLISEKGALLMQGEEKTLFPAIQVLHAKSQENGYLRPSMLPSFLEIVEYNNAHKVFDMQIFEIAKVHLKQEGSIREKTALAIGLSGAVKPFNWKEKEKPTDFYQLKGMVTNILDSLHISSTQWHKSSHPLFHPGRQAELIHGEMHLGVLGEIHPQVTQEFHCRKTLYFAEFDVDALAALYNPTMQYKKISPYPASQRDWTVTLASDFPVGKLLQPQKLSSFLVDILLLDIYKGAEIGHDKKNITLRFTYQSKDKTLSYEEVEEAHEKTLSLLEKEIL